MDGGGDGGGQACGEDGGAPRFNRPRPADAGGALAEPPPGREEEDVGEHRQGGEPEHAHYRGRLDEGQMVAQGIAQMAPGEGHLPPGAEHLQAGPGEREGGEAEGDVEQDPEQPA
jgi:hypothetical protein